MKKNLLIWGLLLTLAFAALSLRKILRAPSDSRPQPAANSPERERLRRFWDHYHAATKLRTEQDFAAAAERYSLALELNTNHEESIYYLGNCLTELGDYPGARNTYRRLVEINPASSRAWKQLGVNLSSTLPGTPDLDYAEAERSLFNNVEINPEESGPFIELGRLALRQEDWEAAAGYFQTAADFRSPIGTFLLGLVRLRQSRKGEAADAFRWVLQTAKTEAAISGRGVASEGDVAAGSAASAAPDSLAATALTSTFLLQGWRDRSEQTGGSPVTLQSRAALAARWAFSDYDGDGDMDAAVAGDGEPARLLQKRGGKWWPVRLPGIPSSAWSPVWADYDRDGDPDLYLIGSGPAGLKPNRLLRNDRDAFRDVTLASGLGGDRNTIAALVLDVDQDGRADLLECGAGLAGSSAVRLYSGGEDGFFREQSRRAGLSIEGTAVDCDAGDYDGDGKPDLFVQRWRRSGLLFHNEGGGVFREATPRSVAASLDSLSALFLDYNGDGALDLFITRYADYAEVARSRLDPGGGTAHCAPRLFRNRGDGSYEEVALESAIPGCFGTLDAAAGDLDGDGWVDLLLANGSLDNDRLEPSAVWLNQKGAGFREILMTSEREACQGAAISPQTAGGKRLLQLAGCGLFR